MTNDELKQHIAEGAKVSGDLVRYEVICDKEISDNAREEVIKSWKSGSRDTIMIETTQFLKLNKKKTERYRLRVIEAIRTGNNIELRVEKCSQ